MSAEAAAPPPMATAFVSGAEATYFGTAGRRLFGWYHPAEQATRGVVICSPVGEESTGWHRAGRHWAEGLANAGIAVLRFDYHGTGDSLGDLGDRDNVHAWVESVADASEYLRGRAGALHIVVAGLRLGTTLALASAVEHGRVDGLILWAPYISGKAWIREARAFTRLMAPAIPSGREVHATHEQFGGLALTEETVSELAVLDPLHGSPHLPLPVLLIPRDSGANHAALGDRLMKAGATVEREVLDGYASVVTDASQGRVPHDVIQGSIVWIDRHFVRAGATASSGGRPNQHSTEGPGGVSVTAAANELSERLLRFGEHQLFGIMTKSQMAPRRRTGVLLVNSGAVYRVGPNRLYVTLAREWAKFGYSVLRMDLSGLGDSPSLGTANENHPYPEHATRDVAAGIAALRDAGAERVVVAGLCSGAHTTFHAALELDDLDGAFLINPVVFYWKPSDPLEVGAWPASVESRKYTSTPRHRTRDLIRATIAALRRRLVSSAPVENVPHDLTQIAARGTDVLLLFSDGDRGHDFLTQNYTRELRQLSQLKNFRIQVLRDADHTFTALNARERATSILTEHLLAHHP